MTELLLYHQLSTRSQRAIRKTKGRFGRDYHYSPRGNLLERLAEQNGMTKEEVYHQLVRERQFLLKYSQYYH